MVDFSDRAGWILLGMVLGYIIRLLQEMRKEVHEVDEIVKKHERDERGFMSNRIAADIAMAIVFAMVLFATYSTGATNNKLEAAIVDIQASQKEDEAIQLRLARITVCTEEYLGKTIKALNERTTYTVEQADANVRLQTAQTKFLRIVLKEPPVTEAEKRAALELYVTRLQEFAVVAQKLRRDTVENPYPKSDELAACLSAEVSDEEIKGNLKNQR